MNAKWMKDWKVYAVWIAATEAVGVLAGLLTMKATALYADVIIKPPLAPPGIVFPLVWAVLYALMGISAARVYLTPSSRARRVGLRLYVLQLAMNFAWSLLFFNLQAFALAFFWLLGLWALVFWMTRTFAKCEVFAAKLQIPYLIWLAFAGYLNLGVWLLNR